MQLYKNKFLRKLEDIPAEQILIYASDQKFDAETILKESKNIAINLKKLGLKENDRVVIATEPGIDFLEIIYACMMCGGEISIIDPEMGRDHYSSMLDQYDPSWAFVDSRLLFLQEHPILRWIYFRLRKYVVYFPRKKTIKQIACGKRLPLLGGYPFTTGAVQALRKLKNAPESANIKWENATEKHPFITTYTSGTLKKPKGVVHSYASIGKGIAEVNKLIKSDSEQRMATHLPHFMLIAISADVPAYVWKESWSAERKLNFIEEHEISLLFAPPAEYMRLMKCCKELNRKFPACLKHIILGSAPAHQVFLQRLMLYVDDVTRVSCLYGMTEHLVTCTVDGRFKAMADVKGDLLGKPVDGVEIKITDENEIAIRSEQLFERYLLKDEKEEYLKTGDLGYMTEDGNLVLTGRKKDMIIRDNFNIYPALYEPTIKKIPQVEEAVLIGTYDEARADEIVHLVIDSEKKLTESKIRNSISRGEYSIAREALPDKIHFMRIPRSGRQDKIDRAALREKLVL